MSAAAVRALWDRVWFSPGSSFTLAVTRALVAAQALWIVLSRPDLPNLAAWPREFWLPVHALTRIRFGLTASLPIEQGLFALLHVSLVAAGLGVRPRLSCFVSATLLYHFAPLEEIIVGMPHTFFGGLTLPVLALFILSFAAVPRSGQAVSPEYRWPVALIQLLFSLNYFLAALAKLHYARGPGWFTGPTIQAYLLGHWSMTAPPWALWAAERPLVCWGIALGTMLLELLFPLAVVSPRAAMLLVPGALLFHIGILMTMRIFFPSLLLLLLFVDWDRLAQWSRRP